MKYLFFILLYFHIGFICAQEIYNSCDNALELCPNTTTSVTNNQANKTLCGGCEDDFNFCFTPINTIWMTFTSNEIGGAIQIDFLNPIFQTQTGQDIRYNACLIEAAIPCNSASYSLIGNCITQASTNQSINATGLVPNTTYYLVLSGEQSGAGISIPSEFTIDVSLSGDAFDREIPYINLGVESTICFGQLEAIMSDRVNCQDPGNFQWYINGQIVGSTTDSLFFSTDLKNDDIISVTSSCFNNCPVTISQTLAPLTNVIQLNANAGNDVFIQEGQTVQLDGQATTNTLIHWSPSYALSDSTVLNPVANPMETTVYTLTITDTISGCSTSDYVTVTIQNNLFFPTTFTPNGDGVNDTWIVLGIEKYPDCLVEIYDRWGQQVFQAIGYDEMKAWDGTGRTGELNESVYFYKVHLRDATDEVLSGSITLIR